MAISKKSIAAAIVAACFSLAATAQFPLASVAAIADSLENVLRAEREPSRRAAIWMDLLRTVRADPKRAARGFEDFRREAFSGGDRAAQGDWFLAKSSLATSAGQADSAAFFLQNAQKLAAELGDSRLLGSCRFEVSNGFLIQNKLD